MIPTPARCFACRRELPLEDLMAVVPCVEPRAPFYVCRPSTQRHCFAQAVRPANEHRIELATDYAARGAA